MNKVVSPALLSIGALARKTGASVRAIRHYDAHGLLTSVRTGSGYRAFPVSAVGQVRQIRRLISAGFSLAEIRNFPSCMRSVESAGVCPQTRALQRKRLESLERKIAELERRRARLRKMLDEGSLPPMDASDDIGASAHDDRLDLVS